MAEYTDYTVEVSMGDITKADTHAITNAANNNFWMGSGVAGAIKIAGGMNVEKEAVAKGPVVPGEAVATTAGKLPYKYVIHAAVMGQDLKTNDRYSRRATISTLNLAEELKLESVALPAFGTGVGGFPMKACATIMVKAARGYKSQAKYLKRVVFVPFNSYGEKAFKEALEENY